MADPDDGLSFENFPEEILAAIWELLPQSDLLSSRLVCKRWATLIKLPFGTLSDNQRTMQLLPQLRHAMFRKMDTLVVRDFPISELPTHAEVGDVVPSYVRRLEIGGRVHTMEGVRSVMDQYCGKIQELIVKDCALAYIDNESVDCWEFQNLKSLKINLVPAPSSCWTMQLITQLFESHMDNMEELFSKKYPKLREVSAVFEATNKWQHVHYNNVLLPTYLNKFGEFLCQNATSIEKLDVTEIVSGKQILKRLETGLVHFLNVTSCSIDMEAIKDYGVPPFEDSNGNGGSAGVASAKLNSFVAWVKSVPEDDLEYMTYTFDYTHTGRRNAVAEGLRVVVLSISPQRVSVYLRITVRPIYNVRHLMLAH